MFQAFFKKANITQKIHSLDKARILIVKIPILKSYHTLTSTDITTFPIA